jgi:hypothetical protein
LRRLCVAIFIRFRFLPEGMYDSPWKHDIPIPAGASTKKSEAGENLPTGKVEGHRPIIRPPEAKLCPEIDSQSRSIGTISRR